MLLGSRVIKACLRVTKAPNDRVCKMCGRRRIKYMQDVRAGDCRAATALHRSVDHSRGTATVPNDPTVQHVQRMA
jgi:hypothetical protein